MIKSQIVVLEVFYDAENDPTLPAGALPWTPAEWNWDNIIDEPITGQRVLAAGPVVEYPRPQDVLAEGVEERA